MASTANTQAATLDEFITSWKAWEPNAFLGTFDQDFFLVTLPSSIGMPPQPRAVIEKMLPIQMELVKNYKVRLSTYHWMRVISSILCAHAIF